MATLHFICGKAASGKTTLARELAARHAAVMFGEDEWLTLLDAEINSLADHVRHSKRLKAAFAPLAVRLLQLDVPIVFDFAGNTPNDRAWVRSIFEAPMPTMCCIISSRPMNRAKRDCACAMRLSRKDSISALSAKTGSTRSRDISRRHQIKKTSM
jgi:predicted kinase